MAERQKATDEPAGMPIALQRAIFVGVLSFMFFLAMMVAYYVRESLLYFLLATAFLIVHILTMISFLRMRRP